MNLIKVPFLLLAACSCCLLGCSTSVDASQFSTSCESDDDCVALGFTDVCSGCIDAAISTVDEAEAKAQIEAAQRGCGSFNNCLIGERAACVEKTCKLVPLD